MNRLWDRLEGNRLAGAVGAAALALSYPLLILAALLPNAWAFGVLALVSYVAEWYSFRAAPSVVQRFDQVQLGVTPRFLVREVGVLILLTRLGEVNSAQFIVFTAALLALHAVRGLHSVLALYVTRRRRLPAVTRNVDLSRLDIPDAPPRILIDNHVRTMLHLDVLPILGALVGAVTGRYVLGPVGGGIALVIGIVAVGALARHVPGARRLGDKARTLRVVNDEIKKYKPEVVLYFSGSLESAYQVNMWLSTLARLERKSMIIMRERGLVPLLGRTSVPVVCLPGAVDLMNFEMPDVRVALFVANVGKNIHMLRIPGIKHVFIGHGDSDKQASFNPFSKVYDEVWVAGRAGRDRYLRAQVGVRDEDIVEVGRPQLAPISRESGPDPMLTVLYAPTWEGWTYDPYHTSLVLMGPTIVRALLDRSPHVRVLYKPHPLTGTRDLKAAKAHAEIVAMIEAANRAREASGTWAAQAAAGAAEFTAARARLGELERRLAELTGTADHGNADEAQLSRDSGRPDPGRDAEWQQVHDAWHAAYWASEGWWRHRVVTGPLPHLYECFNRADVLISDISSVVADFIQSGKPYVVTNAAGLADADFRVQYPTASAAYLLSKDCAELDDILAEVEKDGDDRLAGRRRALKTYLLGPDEPDAMTRFNDAVNALVTKSTQEPPPPRDLEFAFEPEPEVEQRPRPTADEDVTRVRNRRPGDDED